MQKNSIVFVVLVSLLLLNFTLWVCLGKFRPIEPWMAILDNFYWLGLITIARYKRFEPTGIKPRLIYEISKTLIWLTSIFYLATTAVNFWAWKWGIIKYACMQAYTPTMDAHLKVIYAPSTDIAIKLCCGLVLFNLIAMVAEPIFVKVFSVTKNL